VSSVPARKAESAPPEIDDRHVRALAHPLRQRILEILNRRVASPREIAEELNEKLGDVGYHVRMLRDYGTIELVRTEQRRGAIKHYYRATTRAVLSDEQWGQLPATARQALYGQTLEMIWQHARKAALNGGFDAEGARHRVERLELDERGYAAISSLLNDTVAKALQIQERVAGRRSVEDPALEATTELAMIHYLPEGRAD
jgi:DNA-binding transcriptional ArsR family regulator